MNFQFRIFLIFLLCVTALSLNPQNLSAQQVLKDAYWKTIQSLDSVYNCGKKYSGFGGSHQNVKAVQSATFDSLLRPALSNVFLGSNDLATSSVSASFTQDVDKGSFSLNAARMLSTRFFISGNAFSKATDGVFGIYRKGAWSTDVGGSIYLNGVLRSAQFLYRSACESVIPKRKAKELQLQYMIESLADSNGNSLAKRRESLFNFLDTAIGVIDTSRLKAAADNYAIVDSIWQLYNKYILHALDSNGRPIKDSIHTFMEADLSAWERKNANIFTGYVLTWISVGFSGSNNALKPGADSLSAEFKAGYKTHNVGKLSIEASWNCQLNSVNHLIYTGAGAAYRLHTLLDNPTITTPYIKYDVAAKSYSVFNSNGDSLADFKSIKPNIHAFEPWFNITYFGKDKRIGIDVRGDCALVVKKPTAISYKTYPSTFTLVTGPLFRLNVDKAVSAGTVGIDVGFINSPFKGVISKYFAAQLKIGIPINALIK